MMQNKPFSQACENNKQAILDIIRRYFTTGNILEIGSGTGQHAVFFAEQLGSISWHTSDRKHYHDGINQWIDDYPNNNLARPVELDVNQAPWPVTSANGVFSANTAHIMDWPSVQKMFKGVSSIISEHGFFCLYGPVNINGQYTSISNQSFDQRLRSGDPSMGIRDLEDIKSLAENHGLEFIQLHPMPANNVIMVWQQPSSVNSSTGDN